MKYGISGLRRLSNFSAIELKPITLLLGRNSSGKSTFLRSLPLIRQSIFTRTSSPVLWFGDLVDFGSFEESISRFSEDKTLSFEFYDDEIMHNEYQYQYYEEFGNSFRSPQKLKYEGVNYKVFLSSTSGKKVFISRIILNMSHTIDEINLTIGERGDIIDIAINGRSVMSLIGNNKFGIANGSLFPEVRLLRYKQLEPNLLIPFSLIADFMFTEVFKLLRSKIDKRVKDQTIRNLSAKLLTLGLPREEYIRALANKQGKIIKVKIDELLSNTSDDKNKLENYIILGNISQIFRSVTTHFKQIMLSILYIGPARARSERYYRYQDLAVNEIDSDGKNFPMFLNSLTKAKQEAFSKWVEGLYGFSVSVEQHIGHISINLQDRNVSANIVDVGYGISQVLPVLGQIWWATQMIRGGHIRSKISLIAIEQPELHLHPAHQSLLADAIVDALKLAEENGQRKIRFIIETHSEVLVNKIGKMISEHKVSNKNVQIVLFDAENTSKNNIKTIVSLSDFDQDGVLNNWPYGFFQPGR